MQSETQGIVESPIKVHIGNSIIIGDCNISSYIERNQRNCNIPQFA